MQDMQVKSLIYSFMKGYDQPVPYDLFELIIPLLSIDEIKDHLLEYHDLRNCIINAVSLKSDAKDILLENIDQYEEITSHILAVSMIQDDITFNITHQTMCGQLLKSHIDENKIALHLGKLMVGLSKKQVIDFFSQSLVNIVVLQTDSVGLDMDLSELNTLGNVTMYKEANDEDIVRYCYDAQIIVTNKNSLFKEQLEQLPNLKLICLFATGYNNVDIEYCHQHNIQVRNVKGYSTDTVAQHTIALAMHLIEKNKQYDEYVKSHNYSNNGVFSFFGYSFHDVSSLTWGIVGLGNIGKKVAGIVSAMGADVQYYSTSGKNNNGDYRQVDFNTLLATSDIISIHAPLNEQTHHLFNKETMSKMKPHSYLINVGRGPIVKEDDLVELINQGHFDGVGLDVFEKEPIPNDSPLFDIKDMDKVILTPHVAWGSIEARTRLIHEVYLNIKTYMDNEDRNIV